MASGSELPLTIAALQEIIDKRKKSAASQAMRRLNRQLDDLEEGVNSVASQTKTQVEKMAGADASLAALEKRTCRHPI